MVNVPFFVFESYQVLDIRMPIYSAKNDPNPKSPLDLFPQ